MFVKRLKVICLKRSNRCQQFRCNNNYERRIWEFGKNNKIIRIIRILLVLTSGYVTQKRKNVFLENILRHNSVEMATYQNFPLDTNANHCFIFNPVTV